MATVNYQGHGRGNSAWLAGTCALSVFYGFQHGGGKLAVPHSNTGFFVAGFIDNVNCQTAYAQLCAKYKKVYQSPIRKNNSSGRHFFFAVFDKKVNT